MGRGRLSPVKHKDGSRSYRAYWQDAQGKRRTKLLGSDRRVADRRLADIIRKRDLAIAGLGVEQWAERPVDELRDAYLADLKLRSRPSHFERTRGCLELVLSTIGARTVGEVRTEALMAYRSTRVAAGNANSTVNREVAAVKAMLSWAVDLGWLVKSPVNLKRLPQGPAFQEVERRALSEEECEAFLAAARELDAEGEDRKLAKKTIGNGTKGPGYAGKQRRPRVPQAPLWKTFLEIGTRFTETAELTWGEFNEKEATLRIRARTAKGKKERILPVSDELAHEFAGLRVLHHAVIGRLPRAAERIFLTPKGCSWVGSGRNALRRFHAVCERAGIEVRTENNTKLDIHALRVTFCTRLALARVPLPIAQKLMGHSDVRMTAEIYTKVTTDNLRDAVRSVPRLERGETHERKARAATSVD